MKVIAITIICSPLDDALGSEATIRSRRQTVQLVKEILIKEIPKSYRCSLVVATKEN